ncbi:MAG: cyclic nucleotide-binding domain-containing protein [Lawsonibacter sp.]
MAPDLSDQERALLSRCPLFLGVEDALLRSLPALPGVTVEPFAAGEVLYGPGQFRQSLGVILSGQVQVTNGSLSVSLLRAGELFGAAALYNDAPEFAAVLKAQSPCRVLFLPQETLDRLLGEEPSSAATTSSISPGASGSCPDGCARWPRPARRGSWPDTC